MRRPLILASAATAVALALVGSTAVAAPDSGAETKYLVLLNGTQTDAAATAAIKRAGGTVTEVNTKVGYAYVTARRTDFATDLSATKAVAGVAKERIIGHSPKLRKASAHDIERLTAERAAARGAGTPDASASSRRPPRGGVTPEPLADLQWDMEMIGATASGSYARNQGSAGVRMGVIDTGIDGSHPDIAPNFDSALSRNFTVDMPDIDGPCEVPTCVDPNDVDPYDHGTHVASTIGSPINGLGIAGVAPKVTLINLRAAQDSGYFFLKATLDALTYAGDIGVDVVNMSYYTDPWLYNCLDNPADSPEEQAEQRVIREATQRAMNYARSQGVLPIASLGNSATDLGNPSFDDSSPDYPPDAARPRAITNSCISVPVETRGVVAISAVGPSGRKAYYSNYGTEQTDLSAPGGDAYDSPDNRLDYANMILAAVPQAVAEESGYLEPDGTPNVPFVIRDCAGDVCGYYQYLQGTSMAAPHATGVAALLVKRYGQRDRREGGLQLRPNRTERQLIRTATRTACPTPPLYAYTRIRPDGTVATDAHLCAGSRVKNGFYGRGVVSAARAAGIWRS